MDTKRRRFGQALAGVSALGYMPLAQAERVAIQSANLPSNNSGASSDIRDWQPVVNVKTGGQTIFGAYHLHDWGRCLWLVDDSNGLVYTQDAHHSAHPSHLRWRVCPGLPSPELKGTYSLGVPPPFIIRGLSVNEQSTAGFSLDATRLMVDGHFFSVVATPLNKSSGSNSRHFVLASTQDSNANRSAPYFGASHDWVKDGKSVAQWKEIQWDEKQNGERPARFGLAPDFDLRGPFCLATATGDLFIAESQSEANSTNFVWRLAANGDGVRHPGRYVLAGPQFLLRDPYFFTADRNEASQTRPVLWLIRLDTWTGATKLLMRASSAKLGGTGIDFVRIPSNDYHPTEPPEQLLASPKWKPYGDVAWGTQWDRSFKTFNPTDWVDPDKSMIPFGAALNPSGAKSNFSARVDVAVRAGVYTVVTNNVTKQSWLHVVRFLPHDRRYFVDADQGFFPQIGLPLNARRFDTLRRGRI